MCTSPNWPRPPDLLLVAIAPLGRGLNRFAIGDLGLLGVDFHLVAPLEPLAEHQQVQLAHAVHHQLVRLRVAVQLHRAVFLDDLVQRARQLAFVAAALGRDGQADHRRGKLDRRQHQLAQRQPGVQLVDLGHGHDLAGAGLRRSAAFRWLARSAAGAA